MPNFSWGGRVFFTDDSATKPPAPWKWRTSLAWILWLAGMSLAILWLAP